MTHDDLATLLRDDVSRDEPHWLPDVSVPVAAGRRRLRRRRVGSAVVVAAAVALAGAVAVPLLGGDEGRARALDPAEQSLRDYDPQQMPVTLEQHARAVLGRSVPDLGPVTFLAGDGQGQALAPTDYDKASGMSVTFGNPEHEYRVSLDHARSEAEGDAQEYCDDGVAEGYYFACTVETDGAGNVVITTTSAARPMGLSPGETEAYLGVPADELDQVNPARLFFFRTVKVIKSETLVTYTTEQLKAPSLEAAEAGWLVPVADLVEIGADPALVIPEPPTDDSGCGPWTQDPGVSYSC